MKKVAKRVPDELRRDIDRVQHQLVLSQGRTGNQIVAALKRNGPGRHKKGKYRRGTGST